MTNFSRIVGKNIDLILEKFAEAVPEKQWVPVYKFHIVLHGTDQIVGNCDARIGFNEKIYYGGHLGYNINEGHRKKGYATEAVLLLGEVFKANGMTKVYITNTPDNHASIRVCEKLGAKFIETTELPADNDMRIQSGVTHKNIWEWVIDAGSLKLKNP